MRVARDEFHAGEAAGDEFREQHVPGPPWIAGGDLHAERFTMSVMAHTRPHDHIGADDTAASTNFHRECVTSDEGERARVSQ